MDNFGSYVCHQMVNGRLVYVLSCSHNVLNNCHQLLCMRLVCLSELVTVHPGSSLPCGSGSQNHWWWLLWVLSVVGVGPRKAQCVSSDISFAPVYFDDVMACKCFQHYCSSITAPLWRKTTEHSLVDSPHKRPVMRSFDGFLYARL